MPFHYIPYLVNHFSCAWVFNQLVWGERLCTTVGKFNFSSVWKYTLIYLKKRSNIYFFVSNKLYVLHFSPMKFNGIIELYFSLAVHCTFIYTGQMALCITSVPWETAASWSTFPYQTVGKTVLCRACQSGKHLLVCSKLKAGVSLFSPWLPLQLHKWRLVCWQPKIGCLK